MGWEKYKCPPKIHVWSSSSFFQIQLFMLKISKKIALRLGWTVKHNNFLGVIKDTSENKEHIVGILLSCNVKERYCTTWTCPL